MQTLRAGCSNAEPKIFTLRQTPFPGVQDGQNLISWRWSQPSPTDSVSDYIQMAVFTSAKSSQYAEILRQMYENVQNSNIAVIRVGTIQ